MQKFSLKLAAFIIAHRRCVRKALRRRTCRKARAGRRRRRRLNRWLLCALLREIRRRCGSRRGGACTGACRLLQRQKRLLNMRPPSLRGDHQDKCRTEHQHCRRQRQHEQGAQRHPAIAPAHEHPSLHRLRICTENPARPQGRGKAHLRAAIPVQSDVK